MIFVFWFGWAGGDPVPVPNGNIQVHVGDPDL